MNLGSPYPVSSASTLATALSYDSFTFTEQISLASLAGLLARTTPRLYFLVDGRAYDVWLHDLQQNYNITVDTSLSGANYSEIISHFQSSIKGFVLYSNASIDGNNHLKSFYRII
jgi:hypothetical protein